jgi:subfamily B ATP-binding cassette protein MsbA
MGGFWKLIAQTRNYKGFLSLAILCHVLMAIFTIISIPLIIPFFQVLFDRIPDAQSLSTGMDIGDQFRNKFIVLIQEEGKQYALLFVCISIVVVFFLKNLFRYFAMFFMAPVRNGVIRDTRAKLYDQYLNLPLSHHNEERKGDMISRITLDIQEIDNSILRVIEVIFKSPILIIGSIGFMLYISPSLTLFTFLLLLFTAFVIGYISSTLKKQSHTAQQTLSEINSHVEESLTGMRVIKGYAAENFVTSRFENFNSNYKTALDKLLRRRDLSSPLSEFLGITVVAALLYYGSNLVFTDQLKPETFFAFVFAFYNVIEPAKSFSSGYYSIQKGLAAMERVDEIMALPMDPTYNDSGKSISDFKNQIKIDNLSFRYGTDAPLVLEDISLEISKGQKVAFVGVSGGGKSTLIDLIVRYMDPQKGSLEIDEVNYKKVNSNDLRSLFGIVTQDALLFNDTIAQNIRFNRTATEEQIRWAAKIAFADEFIEKLPAKYETSIGDMGVKLSGGQKQRLTIARAVLGDPPILILDEATSSLDTEAEAKVQDALDKALKNKTAIIIAHRLTTIINADIIYVLDKGRIINKGKHNFLLENCNIYKGLVQMQLS